MKKTIFSFFLFLSLLAAEEEPVTKNKLLKKELSEKFHSAQKLYNNNAKADEYESLLQEVKELQEKIHIEEENNRQSLVASGVEEDNAIWDLGEASIAQLILEFGSFDYLYVIPSDVSAIKLHFYSALSIPRENWGEMIDLILSSNGIGVKKLNAYTKILYLAKQQNTFIEAICTEPSQLEAFPSYSRLFYILTPAPEEARSVFSFFEKFVDGKDTTIYSIGSSIVLVANKETLNRLVDLYQVVCLKESFKKVVKVIPISKISVDEAEKVLTAFFPEINTRNRAFSQKGGDGLQAIVLPKGVALVGEQRVTEKAEAILKDLEGQLTYPEEKVIFWYTCQHSAPEEIAELVEKVYESLELHEETDNKVVKSTSEKKKIYSPISPSPVQSGIIETKQNQSKGSFIVDSKTGSICMVIKRDTLAKIKELLRKLDVPKKMVQIDVLLVEKKQQNRSRSGLNLLQLGGKVENRDVSFQFDTNNRALRKGIFDFLLSMPKGKFPAVDLTYSFLMAQDDIKINANPSIIAINQTPATISIVEEISINNGAVQVDTSNKLALEKSFTRAQYGTTLVLTPTIHINDEEHLSEKKGFITLSTNITFDTTQASQDDRPPVTRRHIENEVRVADGETIILGGLKRRSNENSSEKIPFLGEIPGLGKLFSTNVSADTDSEMFIFITPKIIKDPIEDLQKIREEELQKRPGDIPEFLEKLEQAKQIEKETLFQKSMELLFREESSNGRFR